MTTYVPNATCDICLSDTNVKVGVVPAVHADGTPWYGVLSIWSVCDHCNSLGSGLACETSVEGRLVYLYVHVVDEQIQKSFVFYPMMFRDRLF